MLSNYKLTVSEEKNNLATGNGAEGQGQHMVLDHDVPEHVVLNCDVSKHVVPVYDVSEHVVLDYDVHI